MTPRAREDGLVMREVDGEVLVYDLQRHRAHALNKSSALVWQHCDGQTSIPQLTELLSKDLGTPADEQMVWLALEQLGQVNLLESRVDPPHELAGVSRRSFVKVGIGVVGGAVMLPLVSSIVAPTALAAGSVREICHDEKDCQTGLCAPPPGSRFNNCNCNNSLNGVTGITDKQCCVNNGKPCNIDIDCCTKICVPNSSSPTGKVCT